MVLKLYAAPLSTASLRVAQILHEKRVPFEFISIDLSKKEHKDAEYLEKQPFGQVPYIDDDGFILYESRAITRYLALKYPDQGTQGLVPSPTDLKAWALFEQASSNEVANFETFARVLVFEKVFKAYVLFTYLRIGQEPDLKAYETAYNSLSAKLDVYEKILSTQPYLAGDTLTLADLSHLPFATRLKLAGATDLLESESRPHVAKWFKALRERESWREVEGGIRSKEEW
ncbi:hypothetical protein MD484_g5050, partial [Candolleomyces efflorescens]